jgi:hypothetical protein
MTVQDVLEGIAFVLFLWCFPGAYTALTVYLAIVTGLGFPLILGMLTPIIVVWYKAVSKREQRQLEQMLKPYKPPTEEEIDQIIQTLYRKKKE